MKRSIWFWLCFIICIVFAVYFSVRIIMTGMGRTHISRIHNISISADTDDQDMSALIAAATVAPNTPTYDTDLTSLNARVSAVPGVRKSAVRRMPNGNLTVRASLYRAVALWTDGNEYFPLSGDGTIVRRPIETRNMGDIVFIGPVPNDVTEITKLSQNLIGHLDYIEWVENRRWNLHTFGGITIMLPEDDPSIAIGTLLELQKKHAILGKDIKTIDMRDNARLLITENNHK
ncbi:MAG: cell division protein FtsQ/DivIB [Alphaproteobacteria bacterium]|nr:cell division protein FtsQ/DivIB [Alphaproteobacteria bacterium]MBR6684813.1 cell division protein FtsQ/DivIB [Alphaproteobacteria bacterium]